MRYSDEYPGPVINKKQLPMPANFVGPGSKPVPITVEAYPVPYEPMNLAAGWTTIEGAQEHTSAMDRAKALRVRLFPFVLLWALLAVLVFGVVLYVAQTAPVGALLGILTFTALTAFTYYRLNRTDYEFSREGTERHKIDTVADLAKTQMRYQHEDRRDARKLYVNRLERHER